MDKEQIIYRLKQGFEECYKGEFDFLFKKIVDLITKELEIKFYERERLNDTTSS